MSPVANRYRIYELNNGATIETIANRNIALMIASNEAMLRMTDVIVHDAITERTVTYGQYGTVRNV